MKQSEKALAAITGVIVSSVLLWTTVGQPVLLRWRDANDREEQLKDKLERYQQLWERRKQLHSDRDAIEVALESSGAGPQGVDPGAAEANFLHQLDALAQSAQIRQKLLHHVRTDPFDAYAELKFDFRTQAPLKQIQEFLVKMTESEWYLRAASLTVTPREGGEIEANMSLVGLATSDALEPVETAPGRKK